MPSPTEDRSSADRRMECAERIGVCHRMENAMRTTPQTTTGAESGRYIFDQRRKDEDERLRSMERLWDPGTKAVIGSLGIASGWRCLEIGAGRGSIARWLAETVGSEGDVLATDISTLHLQGLAEPNLEVRRHDILTDPLPSDHFDLVHARLVMEHLGRRSLERAVAAVRPGGWLVLEDHDWGAALTHPNHERMRHVHEAVGRFMSRAGFDAAYGRRLVHELERAGLDDVAADGRLRVYRGASPATTFLRLTLESMAASLLASGELRQEDLAWALAALDDPDSVFLTPMIAAWGRKPGARR
jgi:SAM-dependent methyltransferase